MARNKVNKCHSRELESKKTPVPCVGCPYGRNHEFCFPCMKDLLSQKGIKSWKENRDEKQI